MWKIGRYWINPRNITYVRDREDGKLLVCFTTSNEEYLELEGEERPLLLNCLAQHTITYPRLLTDDEPPF